MVKNAPSDTGAFEFYIFFPENIGRGEVRVYRLYLNRYFYFLKELIIVRIMENESKRPVLYLPCKVRTSSDLYAVQAASRQFFVDENRALSAQRKRCFP